MVIKRTLLFLLLLSVLCFNTSVASKIERIDPPYWWIGMQHDTLNLLVKGKELSKYIAETRQKGIEVISTSAFPNPDYLSVKLKISKELSPCTFTLKFRYLDKLIEVPYELKKRSGTKPKPLTSQDVIYLIMPDRFANGDPANDRIPAMLQNTINRDSAIARHGGDIAGIIQHLDYIHKLGVTSLWMTPVLENNQPYESYHGYAITDHYKIDPRLGTLEQLKQLVDALHNKGMKLVWDVVYNHWGDRHYLYTHLPDSSWIHWFPAFTRTSYRASVLLDPYASVYDKNRFSNAWFDHHMPDLNQDNPELADYLIQNSLWWIEELGIDAFRIDTYAYPSQRFMFKLAERIRKEFPDFFMFGETWVDGFALQSSFTINSKFPEKYKALTNGVTDFQLYYAIMDMLNKPFGWNEGIMKLYFCLVNDVLYANPKNNVIFVDNHDLSRIWSVCGKNLNKWKTAMTFLLTTRGIPCIFYGSEILMDAFANPDAKVRIDFPGGWKNDKTDKFKKENLSTEEKEAFGFLTTLLLWRKNNPAITQGQLIQFIPENSVYVYFRLHDKKAVMCILNTTEKNTELSLDRFRELLSQFTSIKSILPNNSLSGKIPPQLSLLPFEPLVFELE